MALALLDLLAVDPSHARLRIDTGTNRYYRLELGRATTSRSGFDWIDDVVHRTPLVVNPRGGLLPGSAIEIALSIRGLLPGPLVVQLFSYKAPDGRSLAFSPVLSLDRVMTMLPTHYSEPQSAVSDGGPPPLRAPRAVACRTCAEQFSAPRVDDLLAQIARVAGPLVLQLLGQQGAPAAGAGGSVGGGGAGGGGAGGGGAAAGGAPSGAVASLLQTIAGLLPGLVSQLSGPAVSQGQSTTFSGGADATTNRFNGHPPLSAPMIFGIDDVLLGSLVGQVAGPLLNVLPQLLNATNQQRLQLQQNQNHLVSEAVGDVERRMLLQQVLQAQQQAPSGQAADLARLADLLQQAGAAPGATPPAAAPQPATPPAAPPPGAAAPVGQQSLVTARSLSAEPTPAASMSARAVATILTAPAISFGGSDQIVFARGKPVTILVKLSVADPAPKAPLPKAIIRVLVKNRADQHVLAEKTVKQRDLVANATVPVAFTAAELAGVAAGAPVSLLAEIRWRAGSANAEHKALGSQDAVFTDRLFVKARGAAAGPDRELTDMNRFRAFWNKVWSSQTLPEDKIVWGLDAAMKFSVLIDPSAHSNGLMETRLSAAADAATDSVRLADIGQAQGRSRVQRR